MEVEICKMSDKVYVQTTQEEQNLKKEKAIDLFNNGIDEVKKGDIENAKAFITQAACLFILGLQAPGWYLVGHKIEQIDPVNWDDFDFGNVPNRNLNIPNVTENSKNIVTTYEDQSNDHSFIAEEKRYRIFYVLVDITIFSDNNSLEHFVHKCAFKTWYDMEEQQNALAHV
jgi:hypothetical protein